jgi:predicted butyrate kinase (DUF1464 family)
VVRVIGIDPGTVSIDLCGLDGDVVFLDRSLPTADALADPETFVAQLAGMGPISLIVGPSGYGLPLVRAAEASEEQLQLAYLAADGEAGGIGGLRRLARALARSALPVMFTPGVIHLASVPDHRKVNRVDMGTADKVCTAALAIHSQMQRLHTRPGDVSAILLEVGGAFTSAIAIAGGQIIDGIGGTSGPIGLRSAGALDGEIAFLAGTVSKAMLFRGGANDVAGEEGPLDHPAPRHLPEERMGDPRSTAWRALIEGAAKAVAALRVALPTPREILLAGRVAPFIEGALNSVLAATAPVRMLTGFATEAKHAAQGAALIASGLAGGPHRELVERLGIEEARGTVLDHLHIIDRQTAWRRLRGGT